MSSVKLTADSGGGTVEIKAPATTTSNAAKVITLSQNPGMIIQVVSAPETSIAAQDHSPATNYSGLSWNCTITPTSADHKILVFYTISFCAEASGRELSFRATRGGTAIHTGDAASSRQVGYVNKTSHSVDDLQSVNFHVVDSPNTTSAVNYGFQHAFMNNGAWLVRNRSWTDTDTAHYTRGASQITAMEISA